MAKITLYYNAYGPDCRRQAARTERLDWLQRVNLSMDDSPIGEVPIGEIVVLDARNQRVYSGIDATRKLCLQVPAYWLVGWLLFLPPLRAWLGRKKPGCNGAQCEIGPTAERH
ncbi:hypothetical protein [Algiphilus sp.]|uniref:hypothetical protein n=1 Tax=Algiphilus sp. TaxID=1872431 RepID=UPI003B52EE93